MSDANTDKIEAFLFELNELLERHKTTMYVTGRNITVAAPDQVAIVDVAWVYDGVHKMLPHKLEILPRQPDGLKS